MDALLLEEEEKPQTPDLKFPRYELFEIAIYECRIYNSRGRLIGIIPAKRIWEVLADKYTEPTRQEYFKRNWKLSGSL